MRTQPPGKGEGRDSNPFHLSQMGKLLHVNPTAKKEVLLPGVSLRYCGRLTGNPIIRIGLETSLLALFFALAGSFLSRCPSSSPLGRTAAHPEIIRKDGPRRTPTRRGAAFRRASRRRAFFARSLSFDFCRFSGHFDRATFTSPLLFLDSLFPQCCYK